MAVSEIAEAAHRAASAVQHGGMAMSVGGGASVAVTEYLGLSIMQWQVVGILSGVVIGVVGLLLKTAIDVFFRWQELKLKRAQLAMEE